MGCRLENLYTTKIAACNAVRNGLWVRGGLLDVARLAGPGGSLLAPEGEPDDDEDDKADQRDDLNCAHKAIL